MIKQYQSNELMSWLIKSRHRNIDKETMKLRTQCLFQNNILENRPSNREKKNLEIASIKMIYLKVHSGSA